VSNVAALPPRRTFGVVRGGIGLPRQLSFGPLIVCLCPSDESIRPSKKYLSPCFRWQSTVCIRKSDFDEIKKHQWAFSQGFGGTASLKKTHGANAPRHGDTVAQNPPHQSMRDKLWQVLRYHIIVLKSLILSAK